MKSLSGGFELTVGNGLRALLVVLLGLSFAANASAQDKSRFELYGGYSVLRVNLPDTVDGTDTKVFQSVIGSLLGWNGGLTANITPNFGITSDFSGYYRKLQADLDGDDVSANANLHGFLFGPRFSGSGPKARPFAHALFGLGRVAGSASVDGDDADFSNTGFAMAFGGGVDFVITEKVSIRAIQFDYFPTRQSGENINQSKSLTLNNFRFGTSIVFSLGK
jgi:opacity protein-like surface antigen